MPYTTIDAAKEAGFPTTINKIPLTVKQVNELARYYDDAKKDGADEPMQVAIGRFTKAYRVMDGAWIKKKAEHADDPGDALRAQIAEIAESPTSDYETEPKVLFKPGKWKGWRYTVEDCKRMAQNAVELASRGMIAQVTIGHDYQQKMAKIMGFDFDITGLPSLGEAKIWWDEKAQAVMTKLRRMPEKLAALVREGRYKTVSAEVLMEWYDDADKKTRQNVIPIVSLLGLEWPGMQGMSDELAIAGAAKHSIKFAGADVEVMRIPVDEIEPFDEGGGDEDMEKLEALQKEVDALKAQLAEYEAAPSKEALAKLLASFDVEDAEKALEKWEAAKAELATYKELDEKAKLAAKEKARTDAETRIDETLEAGVKAGVIDPAQKPAEKAVLMAMDYEAKSHKFADSTGKEIEGTALDLAIAAFKARKPARKFSESGAGGEPTAPGEGLPDETPHERKAREEMGYVRAKGPDGEVVWKDPEPEKKD